MGLREGKGSISYPNGDKEMGNYLNNEPVGKHIILTKDGDVVINDLNF